MGTFIIDKALLGSDLWHLNCIRILSFKCPRRIHNKNVYALFYFMAWASELQASASIQMKSRKYLNLVKINTVKPVIREHSMNMTKSGLFQEVVSLQEGPFVGAGH